MTAQKQPAAAEPEQQKLPSGRKPWKKKTPVETVLAQIDRLRDDLTEREEELKRTRRQLQKLEEVRKVLETA
jgi:hypothetical protein